MSGEVEQNHKFIVIEGNIGAGKTSLSNRISNEYNANLVLEQFADNPFLPKFYKEPDKYAFQLETSFLIDRYDQLKKQLQTLDLFKSFVVSDYYFAKSLIFAGNTLKSDEFALYRKIFNAIYNNVPRPDLYVYLNLPIEKLLKNIKNRGRDYEKHITFEYLEKIQNAYFEYFKKQKDFKFLIINTQNIDFVNSEAHYQLIKKTIFKKGYQKGVNKVTL
ncbi:MAG: deoxynucleoside kinase [Bacteroidales bacterium]|nr:deoxynucleoside kinase [Bacteroidales bacterium]